MQVDEPHLNPNADVFIPKFAAVKQQPMPTTTANATATGGQGSGAPQQQQQPTGNNTKKNRKKQHQAAETVVVEQATSKDGSNTNKPPTAHAPKKQQQTNAEKKQKKQQQQQQQEQEHVNPKSEAELIQKYPNLQELMPTATQRLVHKYTKDELLVIRDKVLAEATIAATTTTPAQQQANQHHGQQKGNDSAAATKSGKKKGKGKKTEVSEAAAAAQHSSKDDGSFSGGGLLQHMSWADRIAVERSKKDNSAPQQTSAPQQPTESQIPQQQQPQQPTSTPNAAESAASATTAPIATVEVKGDKNAWKKSPSLAPHQHQPQQEQPQQPMDPKDTSTAAATTAAAAATTPASTPAAATTTKATKKKATSVADLLMLHYVKLPRYTEFVDPEKLRSWRNNSDSAGAAAGGAANDKNKGKNKKSSSKTTNTHASSTLKNDSIASIGTATSHASTVDSEMYYYPSGSSNNGRSAGPDGIPKDHKFFCECCASKANANLVSNATASTAAATATSSKKKKEDAAQQQQQSQQGQEGEQEQHAPQAKKCKYVSSVASTTRRHELDRAGAFLLQKGHVVEGLLATEVLFGFPRSKGRIISIGKDHPNIVEAVQSFLCGDGFHVKPPKPTNSAAWEQMILRLNFDYIRDNRTRIYTELSKHWRRKSTPFEQFAHFFSYRDDKPYFRTKGMMTHRDKPVIIACLAGNTEGVIILCEMGFDVPADAMWDVLPYFVDTLEPRKYAQLRHICAFYRNKQEAEIKQQQQQQPTSATTAATKQKKDKGKAASRDFGRRTMHWSPTSNNANRNLTASHSRNHSKSVVSDSSDDDDSSVSDKDDVFSEQLHRQSARRRRRYTVTLMFFLLMLLLFVGVGIMLQPSAFSLSPSQPPPPTTTTSSSEEREHQHQTTEHHPTATTGKLSTIVIRSVAAGALTGIVETLIMYPLENIKTQQQLASYGAGSDFYYASGAVSSLNLRPSILDVVRRTISWHGFWGLYIGMSPILIGAIPTQAIRWSMFELVCHWRGGCVSVYDSFVAGLFSGIVVALTTGVVMESVKTHLIHSLATPLISPTATFSSYSSPSTALASWKKDFFCCFRVRLKGWLPTLLKKIVNQAIRFPSYTAASQALHTAFATNHNGQGGGLNPFLSFVAGAAAGASSLLFTQPVDVIKTRMQGIDSERYGHSWKCLRIIVKEEGFGALFSGLGVRALRVCLGAGVTFTAYPLLRALLLTW